MPPHTPTLQEISFANMLSCWSSCQDTIDLFGREYWTLGEWFAAHEQNAREFRRQQAELDFCDQLEKRRFFQKLP